MPSKIEIPSLPPSDLVSLVRSLSSDLVEARSSSSSDNSTAAFDPSPFLARAAPLFAALHASNRDALVTAKESRVKVQDARLDMDHAHLRLQNLLFERNHLEKEIKACEEYQSEYQLLPLHAVSELERLAAQSPPPDGLQVPLPDSSTLEGQHALMLARLAFELAERKRFEEERKSLGTEKAKLVKENQQKKNRLEQLEKQLTEFVDLAKGIQAKMHEEPPVASAPTTA
ncbi:hypothetical protein JCM10212_001284 [Sporobolomyces blumeae]